MKPGACRTVCWIPTWSRGGVGLEHVLIADDGADSVLLAVDEDGVAFRLSYRLRWDRPGVLRHAELTSRKNEQIRSLSLCSDGQGRWQDAQGAHLAALDGCLDIDIWPTPLTNSFPLWRSGLQIGQRMEFRMAWVSAPALTVEAKPQAYTRLEAQRYLFESLDGTGFEASLSVDEAGLVTDYPGLFRRAA